MPDRFFVDKPIPKTFPEHLMLEGAESHHLIHVLRAKPGLEVVLFDGFGDEYPAVVRRVERQRVAFEVLSRQEIDRELPFDLVLGVALPKGERQKWLVEKAVELGVKRLIPLKTCRGVAQPSEQALARLRRSVVEASKQCGRNRLMQIDEPQTFEAFVEKSAGAGHRFLAHPDANRVARGQSHGKNYAELFRPMAADPEGSNAATPTGALLAVGPEGGFTNEEVLAATAAGWQAVDLGPRILRVETAALLLTAIITAHGRWG